jgi:hypothetical protein
VSNLSSRTVANKRSALKLEAKGRLHGGEKAKLFRRFQTFEESVSNFTL